MWKFQKEEAAPSPKPATQPVTTAPEVRPPLGQEVRTVDNRSTESYRPATAHIGKSVKIKGQLTGSEDLYFDGEIEGNIDLPGHTLTIGPNGKIRADISAKVVAIQGNITGNVEATEKVELRNTAVLAGNIATKRIAIDDGAFFKGGVDIRKDNPVEVKPVAASAAAIAPPVDKVAEQPTLLPTK